MKNRGIRRVRDKAMWEEMREEKVVKEKGAKERKKKERKWISGEKRTRRKRIEKFKLFPKSSLERSAAASL